MVLPTLVLIPAGWHTAQSYKKLTIALRAAHYEVKIPSLPSMNGSRPPDSNLETDTAHVRKLVKQLIKDGRTVVVIMHSYGGQVGSSALHGLGIKNRSKAGVAHLIYLAAFVLPEGSSMVEKVKEFGHEELLPLAFEIADDGTVLCREPRLMLIGANTEGVEESEIQDYLGSLTRFNGKCMSDKNTHCAWKEIPVTYISTSIDMTVPLNYQKSMIERLEKEGVEVNVVELATGHCPNLTMTEEVVDVINDVVSGLRK